MACILIVDDDPVSRLLLRHMLERQDHSVVDADRVNAALEVLDTGTGQAFDMIVCDYVMPSRNGLDLLETYLATTSEDRVVPFVLLTGELRRDDLDDERVRDVAAYLTKPVSSSELERVVSEHLRGNMAACQTPNKVNQLPA